jgi:hypothetical protein
MAESVTAAFEIAHSPNGAAKHTTFIQASVAAGNNRVLAVPTFQKNGASSAAHIMASNLQPAWATSRPIGTRVVVNQIEIAIDGNGLTNVTNFLNSSFAGTSAPAAPVVTLSSGGTLTNPSTLFVYLTYVTANGETAASAVASQAIGSNSQKATITAPAANAAATGYNVYIGTTAGISNAKLQNGSPTAMGANFVLSANPTVGGAAASSTNATSLPYMHAFETYTLPKSDHTFVVIVLSN